MRAVYNTPHEAFLCCFVLDLSMNLRSSSIVKTKAYSYALSI